MEVAAKKRAGALPSAKQTSQPARSLQTKRRLRAKRTPLLLLEPNRVLARQYAESLGAGGCDVEWVSDGQMAIFAADKKSPQIVVAEIMLAGHSGIEFLYEFRTYPDWQSVPVVVLTNLPAYELSGQRETLTNLGVTHFLYKPHTTLRQLQSTVALALLQ